jgi:hypothetical protein
MADSNVRVILVCGIPGSGKTTFCKWLESEREFVHLDFDQLLKGQGTLDKLSLIGVLRQDPEDFMSEVSQKGQSIAIDWGFPTASLPLVRGLKEKGATVWWFDGNRVAARISFTSRGTVPLKAFHAQMDSIDRDWQKIKEVIGENIIETVSPGPNYMTPESIFELLCAKS